MDTKISRSKGAGGLRSLIARHGGERIRFFLLRTHYRSTIVFSEEGLAEAGTALDKFYSLFERYERITGRSFYLNQTDAADERQLIRRRTDGELAGGDELLDEVKQLRGSFLAKMDDDFNSGAAVSDLFQLVSALNRFADQKKLEESGRTEGDLTSYCRAVETLRELSAVLGLFLKPPAATASAGEDSLPDDLMRLIIELRAAARKNKDFATADLIRDSLTKVGVTLEDRKDGTGWKRDA